MAELMVVQGLADMQVILKKMPANIDRKILKQAMRAAMRPVLISARANANASKRTGALKKAITLAVIKLRNGMYKAEVAIDANAELEAGARVSKRGKKARAYQRPVKYSHLVEGGTDPHSLGKGSKLWIYKKGKRYKAGKQKPGKQHPGAKAKPFMAPAWTDNASKVEAILSEQLQERVRIEFAKYKGWE